MCLAVPGRIIKINDHWMAVVDFGGISRPVSIRLLPDAREGGWVLVHAGFAIQGLDEEEAEETLSLLEEMAGYGQSD